MNTEDWKKNGVEWQGDGSAVIALTHTINVGGVKTKTVTMLCPSLDQAEAIEKDKEGSALTREKKGMSSLMGLAPEELGQVKFPDYRRLQMVYSVFLEGTPPLFIGGASAPQSASLPATSDSLSTT